MTANPQFLEKAKLALGETDSEKAEAIYFALIQEIESLYGKSQKDVANELQRIAKSIETAGERDAAMEFKQRTCEVMLKISMAERQRNRPPMPPKETTSVPVRRETTFWNRSEILLLATADFETQLSFFTESAQMPVLKTSEERGKRLALLDFGLAYKILLLESRQLSGYLPLLFAEKFDEAVKHLRLLGFTSIPASLDLPGGAGSVFRDRGGNSYALVRIECLKFLQ